MPTPQPKAKTAPAPAARRAQSLPGLLQRKCACGAGSGLSGECEDCSKKRLQRKAAGPAEPGLPGSVAQVLQSPGQPLDATARAFFEPRLGHDFGQVRIHTDAQAAASARAVNALAYTVGNNVVFDAGRYAPRSDAGQRLLAHELVHVVQQSGGTTGQGVGAIDSPEEHEAEAAERLVTPAAGASVTRGKPAMLRRKPAAAGTSTAPVLACTPSQGGIATAAMKLARRWLEHDVIPSLEWYRRFLAGQKKTQIADFRPDVRESLSRHFRITDPQSQEATQLLENLKAMSALLGSGEFRCSAPAGCGGRDAEFDVQGGAVTLCPPFFEQSDERRRARTLVHELAHAKATTDGTQDTRARDLAYPTHRAYTEMSSRQLLNNAESYAAFVHDIATKTVERPREARDTVSQCRVPPFPANSVQLIRGALAIGELWNADAMSATSVRRKSDVELVNRVRARFFDRPIPTLEQMLMHVYFEAKNAFRRDLRFECSTDCESGVVGYYKNFLFIEGSTLYLCPSWFARPTPQARAASLYELVLRRYAGASEVDARRFVGFARAVGPLVTGEPSR